jgi:enterochelin esterase-like enzyme
MTRRRRTALLLLCLPLCALAAFAARAWRGHHLYVADTGDYAGPLTRPTVSYNRSKPPSRPWLDPARAAPPPTTYHTYPASTLNGRETDYLLYLPRGYDDLANRDRRYPVVYWLHGYAAAPQWGTSFVEALDAAIRNGLAPPMIVVLPNGLHDSWYVDSTDGSQPVESIIVHDLIPHIDGTYRTISDRRGRAVEGFSMGAWGAAHLAFKDPNLFCAATMLAPPLHAHTSFPQLQRIFGGSADAYYAEDPVTRARRNADELRSLVRLRIFVGAEDWHAGFARAFHARLTEWNFPHEFAVLPHAGHSDGDIYDALGPTRTFAFYKSLFENLPN